MNGGKKLSVNFSDKDVALLQEVMDARDRNATDVLREAVAMEKWLLDLLADGGTLLVERNGKVREVVFR